MSTRQKWVDQAETLAVKRQCVLAKVSRANVYARRKERAVDARAIELQRLIDEEYTRHPFYGARRMVIYLARMGHVVNRKRVQRLMRQMGLTGMAPGSNTSKRHPQHKVYPYLVAPAKFKFSSAPAKALPTNVDCARLAAS